MKRHPLVNTLFNLKGNPRACVYTEPLWGIPYNLFAPYISIYMYALGVTDTQIGLIASAGMFFQIIFSLLGGIITDKLGRKRTTFIFDIISWSIPCVIWSISQSFIYFLVAAIINSIMKVTANSWGCLLVEDCDKDQIVNIYTWVYISGLGAAFIAPLSGLFIIKYNLIPTVRFLYVVAFVMMTSKFIILNKFCTETYQGKLKIAETKHLSMFRLLSGYGSVLKQVISNPETMLTLSIMLIMSICTVVNNTFWSILVTEKIHIPAKDIGLFPFIRSSIMLIFFFIIIPKVKVLKFKKPLFIGFCSFIASQLIVIITPEKGYFYLILSIFLEACSLSLINPLLDSMQVIMVDPKERARIIAVLYVVVIGLTSPFGLIAGTLSTLDKRLPFVLNIFLLSVGIVLIYFSSTVSTKKIVE